MTTNQDTFETSVKERKLLRSFVMKMQGVLLSDNVDEAFMRKVKKVFQPIHYEEIVEERSVENRCGYPICKNTLPKYNGSRMRIDMQHRKVYDASKGEVFCSSECAVLSTTFQHSLSDLPLEARSSLLPMQGNKYAEGKVESKDFYPVVSTIKEKNNNIETNIFDTVPTTSTTATTDCIEGYSKSKLQDEHGKLKHPSEIKNEKKKVQFKDNNDHISIEKSNAMWEAFKLGEIEREAQKKILPNDNDDDDNDDENKDDDDDNTDTDTDSDDNDDDKYIPSKINQFLSPFAQTINTMYEWVTPSTVRFIKTGKQTNINQDKNSLLQRKHILREILSKRLRIFISKCKLDLVLNEELYELVTTFSIEECIPGMTEIQWDIITMIIFVLLSQRKKMKFPTSASEDYYESLLSKCKITSEHITSTVDGLML